MDLDTIMRRSGWSGWDSPQDLEAAARSTRGGDEEMPDTVLIRADPLRANR